MLSRNKFVKRFCVKCRLCHDIMLTKKPSFCYDFIYIKKPSRFINNCFPKIKITDVNSMMEGRDDIDVIKKVFCSSKVCGRNTNCSEKQIDTCSDALVGQILQMDTAILKKSDQLEIEEFSMGKGSRKRRKNDKKGKKNKSHKHRNQTKKIKHKPKSSFIFGGGEEWQILVQSISEQKDEVEDWKQSITS